MINDIHDGHAAKPPRGRDDPTLCFCYKCDKLFTTYEDLAVHTSAEHTEMTQHACEWCDVTFTDLSDLNVHLESHKGEDYDNSDIVQIDGNVSVLSEKSNPLSQPSTQRKQRGKKRCTERS